MSTKKLATLLAALTVVVLATVGVAYGAWTKQLNVNGTVQTAKFDVVFYPGYVAFTIPGCDSAISDNGHTLTVTIDKAYPGFSCTGGVSLQNLGTIPAKINGLVEVLTTNPVPAAFRGGAGLVYMTDGGAQVPAGGSFILPAGTIHGGVMWDFSMPSGETAHQGETYTFSYTILAEQSAP